MRSGRIDVLLVPVGGRVGLDGAEAAELRRTLSPAITIPMHYRTKAMGLVGLLFARVEFFLAPSGEKPRRRGNSSWKLHPSPRRSGHRRHGLRVIGE